MFISVLIVHHLFHKKLKFLQNIRYEIVCTSTAKAKIAKDCNISKSSPLLKQKTFTNLISLYLHVHKIFQFSYVLKGLKNLLTRLNFGNFTRS